MFLYEHMCGSVCSMCIALVVDATQAMIGIFMFLGIDFVVHVLWTYIWYNLDIELVF